MCLVYLPSCCSGLQGLGAEAAAPIAHPSPPNRWKLQCCQLSWLIRINASSTLGYCSAACQAPCLLLSGLSGHRSTPKHAGGIYTASEKEKDILELFYSFLSSRICCHVAAVDGGGSGVPCRTSSPCRARRTNSAVSGLCQYAKWLLSADSHGFSTLPVCAMLQLSHALLRQLCQPHAVLTGRTGHLHHSWSTSSNWMPGQQVAAAGWSSMVRA